MNSAAFVSYVSYVEFKQLFYRFYEDLLKVDRLAKM